MTGNVAHFHQKSLFLADFCHGVRKVKKTVWKVCIGRLVGPGLKKPGNIRSFKRLKLKETFSLVKILNDGRDLKVFEDVINRK
jgi:hypothetical protein